MKEFRRLSSGSVFDAIISALRRLKQKDSDKFKVRVRSIKARLSKTLKQNKQKLFFYKAREAGEMTQQLGALVALAEDMG